MINTVIQGDALTVLRTLQENYVNCCVTSPPYWGLRNYGVDGQLGLEKTPEEYIAKMVEVFREVRRVLKNDGTCWLNLGDSYAGSNQGHGTTELSEKQKSNTGTQWMVGRNLPRLPNGLKPKDLCMIPARVALALQANGWWLRSVIIWSKPNPMPESVTDRPTTAHEYIYLLAKSEKYYYDAAAIAENAICDDPRLPGIVRDRINGYHSKESILRGRENYKPSRPERGFPGGNSRGGGPLNKSEKRNKRTVWTVATQPYKEAHFATFPEKLIEPCILAGCPQGGIVLDPFIGSGTTAAVALRLWRKFIGIELNHEYIKLAEKRIEPHLSQERIAL